MSLIFTDSFDNYTYPPLKWLEFTKDCCFYITPNTGRNNGQSMTATSNWTTKTYDHIGYLLEENMEEIIIGFAFKKVIFDQGYLELNFNHVDDIQSKLRIYNNNFIWLTEDESTSYGLAKSLEFGTWNYLEVKLRTHTVSGTLDVRINEYPAVSLTDINTSNTVNYVDRIRFRSIHGYIESVDYAYIDDLYIINVDGEGYTDFLGNCEINIARPISQGDYAQFELPPTISGVDHYTLIDDIVYPEDTALYSNYFLEYDVLDDGADYHSAFIGGYPRVFSNGATTNPPDPAYYDGSVYKNYHYWRFSYVNIPKSARITRAWVEAYLHYENFTYPQNAHSLVYGCRSGTPPSQITAVNEIINIPRTYNQYSWVSLPDINGVDITNIIQELVSRSDWQEDDNAVLIAYETYNDNTYENEASLKYRSYSYYNDPYNVDSPRLFVEWQMPGGDLGQYLYSENLETKESYNISTVSNTTDILAINHNVFAKRNLQRANTDDMAFNTLITVSGTTYSGTKNLPTDRWYTSCSVIDEINPVTGLSWTHTDLQNTEFGFVTTYSG